MNKVKESWLPTKSSFSRQDYSFVSTKRSNPKRTYMTNLERRVSPRVRPILNPEPKARSPIVRPAQSITSVFEIYTDPKLEQPKPSKSKKIKAKVKRDLTLEDYIREFEMDRRPNSQLSNEMPRQME